MKKFKFTPSKLMIGLFAVILLGISISTIALPKLERSENENRTLAKFPSLVNEKKLQKAENFGDVLGAIKWNYLTEREKNSFMDDFETYFADHLVGRDLWVEGANFLSRLSGKREINGVYTVDNQMIQTFKKRRRAAGGLLWLPVDEIAANPMQHINHGIILAGRIVIVWKNDGISHVLPENTAVNLQILNFYRQHVCRVRHDWG